jgi:enoyl-CoA hydratase
MPHNFETLVVEEHPQKVLLVKINRPQALNALNALVLTELEQFFSGVSAKLVSAVIVTGAGEKAFVAGADISEITKLTAPEAFLFATRGQKIFSQIENCEVPVIAMLNGFALGGGLELALSCDFIFASDKAKLGLPETGLGLIPGFGGTVRLSRVVGMNTARMMILSGQMLTASEALNCNLVQKVFPVADLQTETLKMAQTLAARGPVAMTAAKKSTLHAFDQDQSIAMSTEAKHFSQLFETSEPLEGTQAFLQKRPAVFR